MTGRHPLRRGQPLADPAMIVEHGPVMRAGVKAQRELVTADRRTERFAGANARMIPAITLGPWHRENVGASDATYQMRLFNPSAASTYASLLNGQIRPGPATRLTGGWLTSSALVTAGTVVLIARIVYPDASILDLVLGNAELNTTNNDTNGDLIPYEQAPVIPAGCKVSAYVRTAGLLPTTNVITAALVVMPEGI